MPAISSSIAQAAHPILKAFDTRQQLSRRVYISHSSSSSVGTSTGAIIAIVFAVIIFVVILIVGCIRINKYQQNKQKYQFLGANANNNTNMYTNTYSNTYSANPPAAIGVNNASSLPPYAPAHTAQHLYAPGVDQPPNTYAPYPYGGAAGVRSEGAPPKSN